MRLQALAPPYAVVAAVLAFLSSPAAWATQAIANGGFEADAAVIQSPDPFTAWTAVEDGILGGVSINRGNSTPTSGSATVGAAGGVNHGVLDLAAPSRMALLQSFSVGTRSVSSGLRLSFDWFANYSGVERAFINGPQGLDYTSNDSVLTLRFDILKAGADAFSTAASDLVFTRYYSAPLAAGPQPYEAFTEDVAGLAPEQSYVLRFSAASNRGLLAVGIDKVSLEVIPVPEPSTWALMWAGIAVVGAAARRRP